MHNESCIIFYYMWWFSTLAFLYGVETKALNQAVKRNTNRFPEDFLFKLTKNEPDILRSQIVTSNLNNNHGLDILISQNATSDHSYYFEQEEWQASPKQKKLILFQTCPMIWHIFLIILQTVRKWQFDENIDNRYIFVLS